MRMGLIAAAVILCLCLGMCHIYNYSHILKLYTLVGFFCLLSTDVIEGRRHPRVVIAPPNGEPLPIVGFKKDFEFAEYEFHGGNAHPVEEDTGDIGPPPPLQAAEAHEGERERGRAHGRDNQRHDGHHHHEHHDHVHIHHTKSISHQHQPKHGYSAGSGLRSIAQGSADQASSAVSNQVSIPFSPFYLLAKSPFSCCFNASIFVQFSPAICSMPPQSKQRSLHKIRSHRYGIYDFDNAWFWRFFLCDIIFILHFVSLSGRFASCRNRTSNMFGIFIVFPTVFLAVKFDSAIEHAH